MHIIYYIYIDHIGIFLLPNIYDIMYARYINFYIPVNNTKIRIGTHNIARGPQVRRVLTNV